MTAVMERPRPAAATGPNRRAKEARVADVAERLRAAALVVLADFQGLTVEQMTSLRRAIRKAGGTFEVEKNSLIALAARSAGIDVPAEALRGNTALATVQGDPVPTAKAIAAFQKSAEKFRVKAAALDGKALPLARFKELADLPSREVLVARLIGALAAPLRNLASTVAAPLRGAVTALSRVAP